MLITDSSNRPTLSSNQNCSSVIQSSGSKSTISHTSLAPAGKKEGQVSHVKRHQSSKKALTNHHPSKIPLRRPTVNHSVASNKMPAAKGTNAGQLVPHKQPVFPTHKQNLSNPSSLQFNQTFNNYQFIIVSFLLCLMFLSNFKRLF